MAKEALPCIVCRELMESAYESELQPHRGLHFSAEGAYGTTAFDPMDLSSLDVVICDECIVKAGRDGIVRLSQWRIGITDDLGVPAGYYSPPREPVVWDPDKDYPRQEPIAAELEEVANAAYLSESVMWRADAVKSARERLAEERRNDEPQ